MEPVVKDLVEVQAIYKSILNDVTTISPWKSKDPGTLSLFPYLQENQYPLVVEEMGKYLAGRHGKWIRPALVFIGSRAFGVPGKGVLEIATAMELIHTATLLHDDVIDKSDIRRGGPTLARKFGNSKSVLMGDLLYTKAHTLVAEYGSSDCQKELAYSMQKVCLGEITQDQEIPIEDCTEAWYLAVVEAKTAALMASCLVVGAMMSKAPNSIVEELRQFGLVFGIAFQIQDDILDLTGSEKDLGKDEGNDILNGKITLPIIHFVEKEGKEKFYSLLENGYGFLETKKNVLEALKKSGSLDYAEKTALSFSEKAKSILMKLEGTTIDQRFLMALQDLTHFIICRNV